MLSNLLLISCNEGEVDRIYTEVFNYNNNTDFSIKIQESKDGVVSEFNIPSSEILIYKIQIGTGGSCSINATINSNSECLIWTSDYLKIIFNSTKYAEFTRDNTTNFNLLNLDNYNVETINNERIYTYNFTELDYNNAMDCNGNCN